MRFAATISVISLAILTMPSAGRPARFDRPTEGATDSKPLFISGDLSGWVEEQHNFFKRKHPKSSTWSVKEGIVLCDGSLGNCGFLRYEKKLGDFTLRLEYRMSKSCNSGVCFRTRVPYDGIPEKTLPSGTGYEIQIQDDAGQPASKTSSGAIYGRLAPRVNAAKAAGDWNRLELFCHGAKIRATLNGQKIHDFDHTEIEGLEDRPRAGYIALQNHGHGIEFRDIRLEETGAK